MSSKELSSQQIYVYRNKLSGITWGATNRRTLSRKSGIPYGKLRYWFQHQGKYEVEFDAFQIIRLPTSMIFNKGDSQERVSIEEHFNTSAPTPDVKVTEVKYHSSKEVEKVGVEVAVNNQLNTFRSGYMKEAIFILAREIDLIKQRL